MIPGAQQLRFPPPPGPPTLLWTDENMQLATRSSARSNDDDEQAEDQRRQATVSGLTTILLGIQSNADKNQRPGSGIMFPWWEVDEQRDGEALGSAYHMKTRFPDGRVGLLIDPGAHDNLIGAETLQKLTNQVGPHSERPLTRPLSVEGVGKESQQAATAAKVPLYLTDEGGSQIHGNFTAPVVPNSALPPLLNNLMKSLMNKAAIMDTGTKRLTLPGPGGVVM